MPTNKISVTDFSNTTGNAIVFGTPTTYAWPSTWSGRIPIGRCEYGGGVFLFFALSTVSPYDQVTEVVRTTDFVTFTTHSIPAYASSGNAGFFRNTVYTGSGFIHRYGESGNGTSTKVAISTNGTSWSAITLPGTARNWSDIAYGSGRTVLIDMYGNNLVYSDNSGATWNTGTAPAPTSYIAWICYGNGVWLTGRYSDLEVKISTSGIGSWTNVTMPADLGSAITRVDFIKGKFVASAYGSSKIAISSDGVAWTVVTVPWSASPIPVSSNLVLYNNMVYTATAGYTGAVYASSDFINWNRVTLSGGDSYLVSSSGGSSTVASRAGFPNGVTDFSSLGYLPLFGGGDTSTLHFSKGIVSQAAVGDSSVIYVTATSIAGVAPPVTKQLIVRKVTTNAPLTTISAFPGSLQLVSTSDGVVYASAYTGATITFTVYKNGIEQSGWGFSTVNDTGLTATISSNTLTITNLTTAVDSAFATITASKLGEISIVTKVLISKNKTGVPSGIVIGASYSAFSTTQTSISLKFLTNGYFQIKYGSGSYANAGLWYNPPNNISPQGGNYWLNMTYSSTTSDTLVPDGSTSLATWEHMNSDREFSLTNSGSGSHIVNLFVVISLSSTGSNATTGTGILRLEV